MSGRGLGPEAGKSHGGEGERGGKTHHKMIKVTLSLLVTSATLVVTGALLVTRSY